jgi:hypothetical protein
VVTGCESEKNGHRIVNLRKHLCFWLLMQQRKIFSSIKRTFSPKQTQNAPKKDTNLRLFKKEAKVGGSSFFLLNNIRFFFNFYLSNEVFILPEISWDSVVLQTDKLSFFHFLIIRRTKCYG